MSERCRTLSEKYFAYDKLEIPEEIKNMSKKERQMEIARLEREAALEKEKLKNTKTTNK